MSMKEVKNAEIRAVMAKSGLKMYQLANYLGVGNAYLSRIMNRELSKANETRIVNAINAITDCTLSLNDSRWIPCSKKQPKAPCLVSDAYLNTPYTTYGVVCITDKHGTWWIADRFANKDTLFYENRIIAWMPLPEPYEGD